MDAPVDEFIEIQVSTSKLPETRTFSLALTDQRDSGRTLQFPGEVSADRQTLTAKIPGDLLRPRNEEDARIFDFYVVVDFRWRSDNRKVLSVLTAEDLESDNSIE